MQFGHHSFTIPSQFPCSLRLQYPSFPSLILQIASSSPSSDCLANPFGPVVDAIELFRRCRSPSVSRVTFSNHNTGGSVPSLLRTLCSSSRRILMSSDSDIFPTSCNFRSGRNLESVGARNPSSTIVISESCAVNTGNPQYFSSFSTKSPTFQSSSPPGTDRIDSVHFPSALAPTPPSFVYVVITKSSALPDQIPFAGLNSTTAFSPEV